MASGTTEQQRARAQNLKPWRKGESGNSGGISKAAALLRQALSEPKDVKRVAQRLLELVDSTDDQVSIKAVMFWIDHVKGKASQPITGEDGAPLIPDLSSLVEKFREAAKREVDG